MAEFKIEPLGATEFFGNFDFGIYKTKDSEGDECYKLKDWQGANLGNIEDDELDLIGAVDRLEIYYNDYIIEPLDFYLKEHLDNEKYKGVHYMLYCDSYENILKELIELNDEKLYGDMLYLYYICNPDKLIDDVEANDYENA